MSIINQAQSAVFANLLARELAGKPTAIDQIDVLHEDGEVICWVYLKGDDCFAVSFKPALPMPGQRGAEPHHLLVSIP